MGILDTVLGGLMGGNTASSPIQSVLSSMLGGQGAAGAQGAAQPGIGGLLQRFTQAGYGNQANSWVGGGPNQSIEPSALQHVFGEDQVNQWSQQTGMAPHDLLSQLSQFLPHAVDQMTPNGQVSPGSSSGSPFDDAGVELPRR